MAITDDENNHPPANESPTISAFMRIDLLGKSKLGFVDGRYPKSKFEPDLHDQWEKVNVVVLSWIMNAVRPGLLSTIVYASKAHKVLEDLKERFDKVNGSRVIHLHREIHTLIQGTMSVAYYFSKHRELWDEFDAFMPCPGCPCPESKKGPVTARGNPRPQKKIPQCDYCHCKGHTKEIYYKLVGYPSDFKSKKKGDSLGV
ncbi:uncharacterized protein [Nicotiana sylvestris]|uniref:Uncharacterized protein LOC104215227 n=1 Tax=Nicotiana sylvestris TaxID=4096 RepID=A0A1U7V517_NICSY|nr:PREDICTED: uncharacterized protein LOC104215227 [Nicotiana sylvestris]